MSERPILFSGPMVAAILAGRKTQTRRIIKGARQHFCALNGLGNPVFTDDEITYQEIRMGFETGMRLWVRERHQLMDVSLHGYPQCLVGYADGTVLIVDPGEDDAPRPLAEDELHLRITHSRWRPSIHMPRWASRITLEVTAAWVEQLNGISERGAEAEGVEPSREILNNDGSHQWQDYLRPQGCTVCSAQSSFRTLWESINGPGSWDENPWVRVVEFKHISTQTHAEK